MQSVFTVLCCECMWKGTTLFTRQRKKIVFNRVAVDICKILMPRSFLVKRRKLSGEEAVADYGRDEF